MKKIAVLIVMAFGFACLTQAQEGKFDPAKMKERELQKLKESDLKLTDAQADSVIMVNMEARQQLRGTREMPEEQRVARMKEIQEQRQKRFIQVLKDEALAKRVAEFYEKQRANRRAEGERAPGAERGPQ